MRCDEVQELLEDHVAVHGIPELGRHLSDCPDCQTFAVDLETCEQAFRTVAQAVFPPERSRDLCTKITRLPLFR